MYEFSLNISGRKQGGGDPGIKREVYGWTLRRISTRSCWSRSEHQRYSTMDQSALTVEK